MISGKEKFLGRIFIYYIFIYYTYKYDDCKLYPDLTIFSLCWFELAKHAT